MKPNAPEKAEKPVHFIRKIIADDVAAGHSSVRTRFPPEPNGYLHIGHAKSICLNFSMAQEFGGACNLRFDDTNPEKEEDEYIESIQRDVRWLGFEWDGAVRFASGYFDQLHEWAVHLIKQGKAYVCHLTPDEARAYRGTLTEPGKDSPYRNRSVEENLALFEQMRSGELPEGTCVLRAKIDMAAPNINLRDPTMYRIRHAHHHQTGDKWKIYPTYDFTHGQSDAIEGVTHSICTLEFEDHRPLYEWYPEQSARARDAATVRVCAAQSHLHGDEQAQAQADRRREARLRLGRPAHADDLGLAPPRLYAGIDSRLLRHHRRHAQRKCRRCGPAGIRDPR